MVHGRREVIAEREREWRRWEGWWNEEMRPGEEKNGVGDFDQDRCGIEPTPSGFGTGLIAVCAARCNSPVVFSVVIT